MIRVQSFEASSISEKRSENSYRNELQNLLARSLGVSPEAIPTDRPLVDVGFDSNKIVVATQLLRETFGPAVGFSFLWDNPTIDDMASVLGGKPTYTRNVPTLAGNERIAIIGLDFTFPGASGVEELWQLLAAGKNAIGPWPNDRAQSADGFEFPKRGGFLADVDLFDAAFFRLSMSEAVQLDPQQRLLLETCWRAIENSGRAPKSLGGHEVGTFVGISTCDYSYQQMASREAVGPYLATGSALSLAANRLSYFFDFTGPSMSIDTACSSSLVATHHACQSLLLGECDLALAGGVNLILRPEISAGLNAAGMLAPDGLCKVFDERADGYVRGEGCAMFVLKRLADARRDKDNVLGVILGSATNHDGRTNGLTAPSGQSQQRVIRKALARAGIDARSVAMVETHGTGTAIGDVIEVDALNSVYGADRAPEETLWLSGVKANLGHLEAAAGSAGIAKALLCLKNRSVPKQAGFATQNNKLPLAQGPLRVPLETQPLQPSDGPLRVAVSSFGFGGANAHLIIEESARDPVPEFESALAGPAVVTLSAKSKRGFQQLAQDYLTFLRENPGLGIRTFAAAVNGGKEHFHIRHPLVCENLDELTEQLSSLSGDAVALAVNVNDRSRRRLLLSLTSEMSRPQDIAELFETEPIFRSAFMDCEGSAPASLELPLSEYLYAQADQLPADVRRILTVSGQVAYVRLWREWLGDDLAIAATGAGRLVEKWASGGLELREVLDCASREGDVTQSTPDGDGRDGDFVILQYPPSGDFQVSKAEQSEGLDDVFARLHAEVLATLFSDGAELRWNAIYPYRKDVAARLPNYPFERKSFWFHSTNVAPAASADIAERKSTDLIRQWREFHHSEKRPDNKGKWVFIGADLHRAEFERYCAAHGLDGQTIDIGADESAIAELIANACADTGDLDGVIYHPDIALDPSVGAEELCSACCDAALRASAVVAAVDRAAGKGTLPFFALLGTPEGADAKADAADIIVSFLSGLLRSAFVETTSLDGHVIAGKDTALAGLCDICRSSLNGEKEVRVAGGLIRVPRLVEPSAPNPSRPPLVGTDVAHIVTGGLGGVGMIAAEWLIEAGSKHIILLQRGSEPKSLEQEERIAAWVSSGARVEIVAADVTSRASLTKVFKGVEGKISGVIHAAGTNVIAGIGDLDSSAVREIAESKLLGWLLINEILPDLEFAIAITSISGVWGAPFLSAYSAANHAVDAIVCSRSDGGGVQASLAFGPIAEGGMVNTNQQQEMAKIGLHSVTNDQVKTALSRAGLFDPGASVHANLDMPRFLKVMNNSPSEKMFSDLGLNQNSLGKPKTGSAARKRSQNKDTKTIIMDSIVEVLELDDPSEVDWGQGFFDLGLDSVLIIDLREKLESIFEIEFPVNIVFDYPNLNEIVGYVDRMKK